jgi:arginase
MAAKMCILIGAPVDSGQRRPGCLMGPDALRTAGIASALTELGHAVDDWGNLAPGQFAPESGEGRLHRPNETIGWTESLARLAEAAAAEGLPVFLGGDHSISLGTISGIAAHAAAVGRPQFVLWLDAHSDFHTPETTATGNLHGTPLAYLTGRPGFEGFPEVRHPVPEENICIIGLRSVDHAEREAFRQSRIRRHDMREIDERGIGALLAPFLEAVAAAGGMLHVSLDVDFLDPGVAPAVGTTVPGGATVREAHLVMEMISDSGLMTSLELVELNPFLDEKGRTALLLVDLAASAMGRRVFDRPTSAY